MKENKPTLSFCITCKNRFDQISHTLPQNLADNRIDKERVEFILVDFGSADGLKDWVLSNFQNELKDGYLKYYYTDELPCWHASIAKNTAHRLASNDIVVNLDCDNYTGNRGGIYVIDRMAQHGIDDTLLHQFSGQLRDGTFGRIAVSKKIFMAVGGYNEEFEPMGYQDLDLLTRIRLKGVELIGDRNALYSKASSNSKEESIRFTGSSLSWDEMHRRNRDRSIVNVTAGRLVANGGKEIGITQHISRCGIE